MTLAVPRRDYYRDADMEAYLQDSGDFDDGDDNKWAEVDLLTNARRQVVPPGIACISCIVRCTRHRIQKMRYCCGNYCKVKFCRKPNVLLDKKCLELYVA